VEAIRLDVWLDVACLFKTRSQAQSACRGGKVEVNGNRAKPHRTVQMGDRILITMPGGWRRDLVVLELEAVHVPRARARELYEDRTPPTTEEERELRSQLRLSSPPPRPRGAGAPKKRERRQLRRLKEGE